MERALPSRSSCHRASENFKALPISSLDVSKFLGLALIRSIYPTSSHMQILSPTPPSLNTGSQLKANSSFMYARLPRENGARSGSRGMGVGSGGEERGKIREGHM